VSAAAVAALSTEPAAAEPGRPIRALIVDDSAVARAVLARMLSGQPGFEVVGQAGDAEQALSLLAGTRADIILLDVEMPGASGIEALPQILAAGQGARVLVVSSMCERGASASVQALARGAAGTLPKPGTENFGGRFSQILAERIRAALQPSGEAHASRPRLRPMPDGPLGCLALGASTGGLHPIARLLAGLPPRLGVPILVTQHLPALFMPFFARQLSEAAGRAACVAEEGMLLRPDEILLAPGGRHLSLEQQGSRVRVALRDAPAVSGCLPSVDVMLDAVASVYGSSGVGVVLSGMGRDGAQGAARLVERGGAILVQDAGSSAVWGMPGAVARAGLASAILPPDEIARRVTLRAAAE
jgi:two-component system chemotaxis response regulator CheB